MSFVVNPMQRGEKEDKGRVFNQNGDLPMELGSLVQWGLVEIVY